MTWIPGQDEAVKTAAREWRLEICERCGQPTEHDRDYGGPFPRGDCPYADCAVNKDRYYGTCPSTRTITVVEKVLERSNDG